jgi:hypothetical protein
MSSDSDADSNETADTDAGVSTRTLTVKPDHLAALADSDTSFDAGRIVLKMAAGDVRLIAKDGALVVERA